MVFTNTGDKVPLLRVNAERLASEDSLITVTLYVLVVVPSCAVTTTWMVLMPTNKEMAGDAAPEVTAVPFTFMVAVGSLVVGVSVIDAVA